jgi:hypothetical protein
MDCQFDCSYSWSDMIDDLDNLTAEEKKWAKEHSTYAVKLDEDEQQRDELLAAAKGIVEGIRHLKGQLPEQMKNPYLQLLNIIARY